MPGLHLPVFVLTVCIGDTSPSYACMLAGNNVQMLFTLKILRQCNMDATAAGVMALYIPLLVDWDPACPGRGSVPLSR